MKEKITAFFRKTAERISAMSSRAKITVCCSVAAAIVAVCVLGVLAGKASKRTQGGEEAGDSSFSQKGSSSSASDGKSDPGNESSDADSDDSGQTDSDSGNKDDGEEKTDTGSTDGSGTDNGQNSGSTGSTGSSGNKKPSGSTRPDSDSTGGGNSDGNNNGGNVTQPSYDPTYPDNSTYPTESSPTTPAPTEPEVIRSEAPNVTRWAQVATGIYIVGGTCPESVSYISVGGSGVTPVDIYPIRGEGRSYFIGQVHIGSNTVLNISSYEYGKEASLPVNKTVANKSMSNLMTRDEYMPVFGKNSRMHFYSSILCYTASNIVPQNIINAARSNISRNVNTVKSANGNAELIYLVVPSSAAIYPETLPDEYSTPAWGDTLFDTFSSVARSCGAAVIYPFDSMYAHRNDSDNGLKVYSNTDSHWTAYGAYFGTSELFDYISKSFPAAAPRTLSQMNFYTKEMWGGDSLFSFGDGKGFENISQTGSTGRVPKTRICEMMPLYYFRMPTETLREVYRGYNSAYVSGSNGGAATFTNPNGAGLPTAVILRDSFSCTSYDMINDRFSKIWWQESHRYQFPSGIVSDCSPDYVIYVVSERNLLKVMTENSNYSITQFAK